MGILEEWEEPEPNSFLGFHAKDIIVISSEL